MKFGIMMIPAALLAAGTFSASAAEILGFLSETTAITAVDAPFQVLGRVVNESDADVEGFSLTLSVDGKKYVKEYPTRFLAPGSSADITWITDFVPAAEGVYDWSLSLESAGLPERIVTGSVFSRTRRWVVEERTGTWCGACPQGIYVFGQLAGKMEDRFIGIALHTYGDDPMGLPGWQLDSFTSNTSAPYCMVNRSRGCHPMSLEAELENMSIRPLYASVENVRSVFDPVSRSLEVSATVMFDKDYDDADMRLGYYIVENGVCVDDKHYAQTNNFAGRPGMLPGWDELPNPVPGKDMVHNHVARGFSGDVLGVRESLPDAIAAGELYEYTHRFDLPDNVLNAENCRLVVMVNNARTSQVLNAVEIPLDGGFTGAGCGVVAADGVSAPVVYDLGGIRRNPENLAPGLYIMVRDGKRCKILVK